MMSLNKVLLIGRLGADPEVRYTPDNVPVVNINIATNEVWTDKQGNKQEKTEWHRIVFWRGLAELAGKYLKKGSAIYIEGKIQKRDYTDANGVQKTINEIIATDLKILSSIKQQTPTQNS